MGRRGIPRSWMGEELFGTRCGETGKFVEELSARQKQRTNETILDAIDDDADIVASSDVFRAFEADLQLFGSSAFQRSLPEDDPPK